MALPTAASSRADAAPSTIVDMWSRTVTEADAKRRGMVTTGPWRFEVKPSGAMSLYNSSGKKPIVTGKLTAGPSGTLKMLDLRVTGGGRCDLQSTYRWRLSGGKLTLSTTGARQVPGSSCGARRHLAPDAERHSRPTRARDRSGINGQTSSSRTRRNRLRRSSTVVPRRSRSRRSRRATFTASVLDSPASSATSAASGSVSSFLMLSAMVECYRPFHHSLK